MNQKKIARLFFSICFLLSNISIAQSILIPQRGIGFREYSAICESEKFKCTYTYLTNLIAARPTLLYDQFVSELDLLSTDFKQNVTRKIREIIEQEMISIEQLESLVLILDRIEKTTPTREIAIMYVELKQLHYEMKKILQTDDLNYFIFKKPVAELPDEFLKTLTFKPKTLQINYNSVFHQDSKAYFKENQCGNARLNNLALDFFKKEEVEFIREESCGWTDSLKDIFQNSNDLKNHQSLENSPSWQNPITWAIVGIAIGVFASKYEVQIEY